MKAAKFLFLFILQIPAYIAVGQTGTVKGMITDQQTHQPVDYATVALLKGKDSSVLSGVLTKTTGNYEFTGVTAGNYLLKVSFLGYRSGYSQPFVISGTDLNQTINLALSPSQKMLNEVAASGQKINALNKIDKQSYKAGQFETAKGGTAIDVLKNLPSVNMNGEGDISVRGSAGFMVLINGKPVLTDAQTVLSQLPANAVDNIELITAPSAKYDPDGRGGIINIVTKKGLNDGFTLAANAQGGLPATIDYGNTRQPKRFGGDLTLNYRKGKWDISVGGNYNRNDNAGYREGDAYTIDPVAGTITRFPSTGERSFKKYNYAGRTTINFTTDANNTFSAGFFAGKRYQDREADLVYHNTTSSLTNHALVKSTTYYNANTQTKEGNFTLANFDYTHTFTDKATLTAGFVYEHADLFGNTRNRNLKYPNTADTIQYVYNPYKRPINGYRLN